jgi:hypothetical protein
MAPIGATKVFGGATFESSLSRWPHRILGSITHPSLALVSTLLVLEAHSNHPNVKEGAQHALLVQQLAMTNIRE